MIMLTVMGSIPSNITYEEVPDWRKADYNVLVKELSVAWDDVLKDLDTLKSWEALKSIIKR